MKVHKSHGEPEIALTLPQIEAFCKAIVGARIKGVQKTKDTMILYLDNNLAIELTNEGITLCEKIPTLTDKPQ